MDAIRRAFDEYFAASGVTMPAGCLTTASGGIHQNGWDIAYRWGTPRGAAPYLDLYTSHRMTNDRLYRIHADGHVELVASVLEWHGGGEEGRRELHEHNQAFEAERRRRGF